MIVELTLSEVLLAAEVGIRRRTASIRRGIRRNGYDCTGRPSEDGFGDWEYDIGGACGELALAKARQTFWSGQVNDGKNPDVGRDQVRHTHRKDGCLIFREGDNPEETYVLVVGSAPTFRIVGKIKGRDAMRPEWSRPGSKKAWFVPQNHLDPMPELTSSAPPGLLAESA